jgi:nitroimidazol reductase NimA-like FMN-containing flavoprotein (pyridoxamine 5'-phosphate oxidase superfamily)
MCSPPFRGLHHDYFAAFDRRDGPSPRFYWPGGHVRTMTNQDDYLGTLVGREALALSEAAVADFLERTGYGVLSLTRDGEAVALPVSFGYDGDRTLYFQFGRSGDSEKMAAIQETDRAAVVAYEVTPPSWQSVVARGPVGPVPEDEKQQAHETHRENAWVPMNAFETPLEEVEFSLYKLEADGMTGYGTQAVE